MSEAEKLEAKTGKRIVSKGKYAVNVGRKGMAYSVGASLLLIGLLCLFVLGLIIRLAFVSRLDRRELVYVAVCTLGILLPGSIYMFHLARRSIREAKQMKIGVPLTRANTGDLPAPESLVRASEQPLQAQETVLLRAATPGSETSSEQLVRPAGTQE